MPGLSTLTAIAVSKTVTVMCWFSARLDSFAAVDDLTLAVYIVFSMHFGPPIKSQIEIRLLRGVVQELGIEVISIHFGNK